MHAISQWVKRCSQLTAPKAAWLSVICWQALTSTPLLAGGGGSSASGEAVFPKPLTSYGDSSLGLLDKLAHRIDQEPMNLVCMIIFVCAILHTFASSVFQKWAHDAQHAYEAKVIRLKKAGKLKRNMPESSFQSQLLHYLGEVEAIFGLWVVPLVALLALNYGWSATVHYLEHNVNFVEAMFVVVIMALSATRPIMSLAEHCLRIVASLGKGSVAAWWLGILIVGPILGSFITEPAAMTIAALLLSAKFYKLEPSLRFRYGTLGLLFVNISVGGTLTNFAAPPVLMVAGPWGWSTPFMLTQFGWKAVIGIIVSTMAYFLIFRSDFRELDEKRLRLEREAAQANRAAATPHEPIGVPAWVTAVHLLFMGWTVINAHHPVLFIGSFLLFLGFHQATSAYQTKLQLKESLLVGFFLAGLVIHGGLQGWWISPLLGSFSEVPLMLMATGLTAVNDNAAITYLSTLVQGMTDPMKYAVVVGAVTGGGLTVIANAPNPAGQSILAKHFPNRAISPAYLFLSALFPTVVLGLCFMAL